MSLFLQIPEKEIQQKQSLWQLYFFLLYIKITSFIFNVQSTLNKYIAIRENIIGNNTSV